MGDKVNRGFHYTFHGSGNRNSIRDHGYYGEPTFLSPSSHGDSVGRGVPTMGALYHEEEFFQCDETSNEEKIPFQNVGHLNPQNHVNGSGPIKSPINSEFDNFSKKKEDCGIHVRSIDPQRKPNGSNRGNQQVNSNFESGINTGNKMVLFECSGKIQILEATLGPLLRVGTLEGPTWTKKIPKKQCQIVLPYNIDEEQKHETDSSMRQVSAGDGSNETHGHCRSPLMVVDTVMKSNRNYVANLLDFGLQDQIQDDDIVYTKEDLGVYIEEVRDYGFDHIIVIGERYCGLLFMDCFGRVFDLDSMGNVLWLCGDYPKIVERVTKGLETDREVPWVVRPGGIVIETKDYTPDTPNTSNTPNIQSYDHYIKKNRPKKKKKSPRKKRHY